MAPHWHSRTHARLSHYPLGSVDIYQLAKRRLIHMAGDVYVSLSRWYMHSIHPYRDGIQGATYSLVLASIPLIAVGIVIILKPQQQHQPLAAIAVQTEGVTAQRQDMTTFNSRWLAAIHLPPATVVHEVPTATQLLSEVQVPTPKPRQVAREHPAGPSARRLIKRSDICSRHNMRRVNYGRTWRCRK